MSIVNLSVLKSQYYLYVYSTKELKGTKALLNIVCIAMWSLVTYSNYFKISLPF